MPDIRDIRDIRDLDALEHWWRPGALPRWVVWTLAAATVTTILVAYVGASSLASYLDPHGRHSGSGLRSGPALSVTAALILCWWPRWELSRPLRVAVLLPLVQILAIGVTQLAWHLLARHIPDAHEVSPLVSALPFTAVIAGAGAFAVITGRAIAGRRRGEWMHATAMLALVHLLLVGLWLPVMGNLWCANDDVYWYSWSEVAREIASPRLVAWVLVPPAVVATAFTTLAIRRYDWMRARHGAIGIAAAILLVTAIIARLHLTTHDSLLYSNFVHVLLALVAVAAGALAALGTTLWLRARAQRREVEASDVTGTIAYDDDDSPVACLQIAGWLRGPRVLARAFTVSTDAGEVVVPAGATIACAPPDISTRLASGEAMPVLRSGDRVALAGFGAPADGAPFRSSSALIAGTRGVFVGRVYEAPARFTGVALAMWRPCIAYLVVILAIALPALAGALAAG